MTGNETRSGRPITAILSFALVTQLSKPAFLAWISNAIPIFAMDGVTLHLFESPCARGSGMEPFVLIGSALIIIRGQIL